MGRLLDDIPCYSGGEKAKVGDKVQFDFPAGTVTVVAVLKKGSPAPATERYPWQSGELCLRFNDNSQGWFSADRVRLIHRG